jgi:hypothetical protein
LAVATAALADQVAGRIFERAALVQTIQEGLVDAGAHRALRTRHHQTATASASRRIQERIGEGLVRLGFLSEKQCEKILELQASGDRRLFGEIALTLGFIDFDTLIDYLRRPGAAP